MSEPLDINHTLVTKSDQLNADDIVSKPIVVQVTRVTIDSSEQPVSVHISGGYQPWKPCKTMRRVLAAAWGAEDANVWIGRWLRLYRDPAVRFGAGAVGGIRLEAMSHIRAPIEVNLNSSKGKKALYKIAILTPPVASPPMSLDDFKKWCTYAISKQGWTKEQVTAAMGGQPSEVPPEKRAELAALFSRPPVIEPPIDPADAPQHGD